MELRVADVPRIPRFALPVDCDLFAPSLIDVTIEAIVGKICAATIKPSEKWRIRIVEHRVPLLKPMQLSSRFCPKGFGILDTFLVERPVGRITTNVSRIDKFRGRGEFTVLVRDRLHR